MGSAAAGGSRGSGATELEPLVRFTIARSEPMKRDIADIQNNTVRRLLMVLLRVDIKQYMLWRKGFRVGWQSCGAIMPHAMYPCSPQNPFWDS